MAQAALKHSTSEENIQQHAIVTPQEWLAARKDLLRVEKEFTRQRDELSRLRRELPWVKVTGNYIFDGPNGKQSLSDLFAGKSQLFIYHFMFGPGWEEGCPSCSLLGDHVNGILTHLAQRDVSYVAVSRARVSQIEAFKQRLGWDFKWVSSFENGFNRDFNVSFSQQEVAAKSMYYNYQMQEFPADEAPGLSVFYKDENGEIFHTYSVYSRGLDILLGIYNLLDMAPKGRDEESFTFPMAWVRHHDRYPQEVTPIATKTSSSPSQEPSLSSSLSSCCGHEAK